MKIEMRGKNVKSQLPCLTIGAFLFIEYDALENEFHIEHRFSLSDQTVKR